MKAVMRELAQAKRHYSTLPLFEYLRDESLSPRERLSLVPGLAAHVAAHERFAAERIIDIDGALRTFLVDVAVQRPLLAARLAQIAYPATPVQTRVIVESLGGIGSVWLALVAGLAVRADMGATFRRVDSAEAVRARNAGHELRDRGVLESIALDAHERASALEIAFRVFDLFADWSYELHREARESLARHVTPHTVHTQVALCSAT